MPTQDGQPALAANGAPFGAPMHGFASHNHTVARMAATGGWFFSLGSPPTFRTTGHALKCNELRVTHCRVSPGGVCPKSDGTHGPWYMTRGVIGRRQVVCAQKAMAHTAPGT